VSSIPDERDWKREVQNLREHTLEFNIDKYLKIVLTKPEQAKYQKIIAKIPKEN
jgi:hypothetical protein